MCKKILIVEDSKNISLMVKMCLEKKGYEVISVNDGVEAIENTFKLHPDLILLDVVIPKMNGYLVAQTIKQDDDTRHIPIIMMTAKAQIEDINNAMKIGVEDYLVKPFSTEILMEKIKKYASQEGYYGK